MGGRSCASCANHDRRLLLGVRDPVERRRNTPRALLVVVVVLVGGGGGGGGVFRSVRFVVKEKTYKVDAGFIVRPFLLFLFFVSLVLKKTPTFSFPRKKNASHLISSQIFASRSAATTTLDESPTESVPQKTKKHSHKCR